MHLAEPIKVFLAMRRVKIEAKHLLLKFKSHPHGDFGVWHLLKSHYEKWVQKSPEALRHLGFWSWHPNWMHNMVAEMGFAVDDQCSVRIFFGLFAIRRSDTTNYAMFDPDARGFALVCLF